MSTPFPSRLALQKTLGRPVDGYGLYYAAPWGIRAPNLLSLIDVKGNGGACVAHGDMITRRRGKLSLFEILRILYGENGVDSCVECVLTLLFQFGRWIRSFLNWVFIADGLSVFRLKMTASKVEMFPFWISVEGISRECMFFRGSTLLRLDSERCWKSEIARLTDRRGVSCYFLLLLEER